MAKVLFDAYFIECFGLPFCGMSYFYDVMLSGIEILIEGFIKWYYIFVGCSLFPA